MFAMALTLWGPTVAGSAVPQREGFATHLPGKKAVSWLLAATVSLLILSLPSFIKGGDWNGFIQYTIAGQLDNPCSMRLPHSSQRPKYPITLIIGIILLAGFGYKSLQATVIFWAKPLGKTDDEFARSCDNYAINDASFDLVNNALGNGYQDPCGDLCRILREYTNIPNFPIQRRADLVKTFFLRKAIAQTFSFSSFTPCALTTWALITRKWTLPRTWMPLPVTASSCGTPTPNMPVPLCPSPRFGQE